MDDLALEFLRSIRPERRRDTAQSFGAESSFPSGATEALNGVGAADVGPETRKSTTCFSVCKLPRCSGFISGAAGSSVRRAAMISTRLIESTPRSESKPMSKLSISTGYPVFSATT